MYKLHKRYLFNDKNVFIISDEDEELYLNKNGELTTWIYGAVLHGNTSMSFNSRRWAISVFKRFYPKEKLLEK